MSSKSRQDTDAPPLRARTRAARRCPGAPAKDVAALRSKKAQLQSAVANQELSASDVEAMRQGLTKLEERYIQ